jgi:hypothetical protein
MNERILNYDYAKETFKVTHNPIEKRGKERLQQMK